MKLTRENVYIDLQGKSKEELTDLFEFLTSNGEKTFYSNYKEFLKNAKYDWHTVLVFGRISKLWVFSGDKREKEVTIQQLKEILQPMICTQEQAEAPKLVNDNFMSNEYKTETLQEKEQRLLKELEEVRKEIEESKIKAGDWVWNALNESCYKKTSDLFGVGERKITNQELIKLLEQETNKGMVINKIRYGFIS